MILNLGVHFYTQFTFVSTLTFIILLIRFLHISLNFKNEIRNLQTDLSGLEPRKHYVAHFISRARAEPDGTRAETTFRLSPKRTSPFKSAGKSVQSTAGSRGVRISVSNGGYTTFRGSVRVLATHSIHQFPLHFPSRASPCATRFRKQYTHV